MMTSVIKALFMHIIKRAQHIFHLLNMNRLLESFLERKRDAEADFYDSTEKDSLHLNPQRHHKDFRTHGLCVWIHIRGIMYECHEIQQIMVTCGSPTSKLGLSATNYSSLADHKPPSMKGEVRLFLYGTLSRSPSLPHTLSPYNIRQISHLSYKVPLTFRHYDGFDRAS